MTMVELIKQKLEEYGIPIIDTVSFKNISYIMTDDMAISYDNEKERLSIAFNAMTVPDRVANDILILQEIEDLNPNFKIMESFTYNNDGKLVTGKEAHQEKEKKIGNKYINDYKRKEEDFRQLLDMDPVGNA